MRETVREWLSAITIWEKIALAGAAGFAIIRLALAAPEIFPPYRPISELPENTGIVATESEGEVAGSTDTNQAPPPQPIAAEPATAEPQPQEQEQTPPAVKPTPPIEEPPAINPPVNPPNPIPDKPAENLGGTLETIRRVLPKPLQDLL